MLWTDLERILTEECLLAKDRPIVVGVSGGPDSLCLLHVLHKAGYEVIAAHVNHQLRPEAAAEANVVAGFANSLGVPFVQTSLDVRGYSEQEKLSIEESARILRYRFLMETAEEANAQAIAVAHQADDQIETVLMHLLRGSGLSGLKGMPYRGYLPCVSKDIPIVRPLLGFWREQILEYCAQHDIHPCYDATNEEKTYFRNRIPHELVPLLSTYNLQAPQHIWQLSQLAGTDDRLLESLATQAENEVLTHKGNGFAIIVQNSFLNLDLALQRRLMRSLIANVQDNVRDIPFDAVENCIKFFTTNSSAGTCQLLEDVWLSRFSESELCLYRSNADFSSLFPILSGKSSIKLIIPGETRINEHWRIMAEFVEQSEVVFQNDVNTIFLDYDQCLTGLKLDQAKTSDRVGLLGQGDHSVKLGDLFTNQKVFKPVRANWPVLKCGDELIWVVGLKRANAALVNEPINKILRLILCK
jgi:tRNA(Ile)-lysidine synthase